MIPKRFLFVLPVFLSTQVLAGGIVGNGGDTLFCLSSPLTPKKGYYSLDYMVAVVDGIHPYQFASVVNWEESAQRIKSLLARAHTPLAENFEKFYDGSLPVLNQGPPIANYIWKASPEKLKPVKDEGVLFKIPSPCKLRETPLILPDEFYIVQTVIRSEVFPRPVAQRIYKYSDKVFLNLTQNPLQFSMMMVHEWAWDLTQDVQTVRSLNQFLHMKSTDQLSGEEIRQFLKKIGIDLR